MRKLTKLNETDDKSLKKLITLSNSALFNGLVKDAAVTLSESESSVIESTVISNFLSPNDEMAYAVKNFIYEENGICKSLAYVFNYFSSFPQKANESIFPLIEYVTNLEARYPTHTTSDNPVLKNLKIAVEGYTRTLRRYKDQDIKAGTHSMDEISIDLLEMSTLFMHDSNDEWAVISPMSELMKSIETLWKRQKKPGNIKVRHWYVIYTILTNICKLADWPCEPEYRYDIIKLIKDITISEDQTTNDNVGSVLVKKLIFNNKELLTTDDAIVLKNNKKREDRSYKNACRIIHGPGHENTKHPFILLYDEEDQEELIKLARELAPEADDDEFPSMYDVYSVPILYAGEVFDERIQWSTV